MTRLKEHSGQATVEELCDWFGFSRAAYYKSITRQERAILEEEIIVTMIRDERKKSGPRMGIKKVYHAIQHNLRRADFKLGRDAIYDLARRNELIIKPKKKRRANTTDSSQWRRQFPDLRQNLKPHLPERLWVSDITYLSTLQGFVYLSLITDAGSRRIMGAHVHEDLSTTGCLWALQQALAKRLYPAHKLMHHSDRGCQYCSAAYVAVLKQHDIAISMTRTGSPYDNALAESVNGQLKVEYDLDATFYDLAHTRAVVERVIGQYNERRPHGSIDYRYPAEYHRSFLIANEGVNAEPEGAPVCQPVTVNPALSVNLQP